MTWCEISIFFKLFLLHNTMSTFIYSMINTNTL